MKKISIQKYTIPCIVLILTVSCTYSPSLLEEVEDATIVPLIASPSETAIEAQMTDLIPIHPTPIHVFVDRTYNSSIINFGLFNQNSHEQVNRWLDFKINETTSDEFLQKLHEYFGIHSFYFENLLVPSNLILEEINEDLYEFPSVAYFWASDQLNTLDLYAFFSSDSKKLLGVFISTFPLHGSPFFTQPISSSAIIKAYGLPDEWFFRIQSVGVDSGTDVAESIMVYTSGLVIWSLIDVPYSTDNEIKEHVFCLDTPMTGFKTVLIPPFNNNMTNFQQAMLSEVIPDRSIPSIENTFQGIFNSLDIWSDNYDDFCISN